MQTYTTTATVDRAKAKSQIRQKRLHSVKAFSPGPCVIHMNLSLCIKLWKFTRRAPTEMCMFCGALIQSRSNIQDLDLVALNWVRNPNCIEYSNVISFVNRNLSYLLIFFSFVPVVTPSLPWEPWLSPFSTCFSPSHVIRRKSTTDLSVVMKSQKTMGTWYEHGYKKWKCCLKHVRHTSEKQFPISSYMSCIAPAAL